MHAVSWPVSLDLKTLRGHYASRRLTPRQVIAALYDRIETRGDDGVWISRLSREEALAQATRLEQDPRGMKSLPLYGVPFSVKDCVDVAGQPTTSACPALSYTPDATNPAVQRLMDTGALYIGKTNLDQFATGLVGVRTPYTIAQNPFDPAYMPGGSSSGAAVSVAAGLVGFAIGTDTGGSGRVPAGCNNVVGLKPTRGLLSTSHMVSANKSIDCLSIFALTCADAVEVLHVAQGFDPTNPYSRRLAASARGAYLGDAFRFAVPAPEFREFFGNDDARRLYEAAIKDLVAMGGTPKEIDYAPFKKINDFLFWGPWVAERLASLRSVTGQRADALAALLPVTRAVISLAERYTALDTFEAFYELESVRRQIEPLWDEVDVLVLPTTGTIYRIAELEADPINLNRNIGHYTYFLNMLDLAAIAVPNGFQGNGLPTGVTFNGPAFSDHYLAGLGAAFHQRRGLKLGATSFNLPA